MPTRTAEAVWTGNITEGKGELTTGSGAFKGPYDWKSRSAEGATTNPEELLGAAHAGCFSMALTGALGRAG
jgi:osmotically inducible protein OsmC